MDNSTIKDIVIAITGASSGIGEAIARYTAQQGAKVVLGARRTDKLADITTSIRANGGQAAFTELDVFLNGDRVGGKWTETGPLPIRKPVQFNRSRFCTGLRFSLPLRGIPID